jgi:alginate O-acetyltransferase complex protein AlgI
MLFCSQTYLYFFTAVFLFYWTLPWKEGRVWLLLAASVFFYTSWSRWLALLVVGSATLDYALALALDASSGPRRRRLLLAVSLTVNLAVLALFKYLNFFLQSLHDALAAAGVSGPFPLLDLLAPIGISFYTFEAVSYTVDVYRRRVRAERNLGHFLLFILFFPHLVAGPIVRARDFLPQVRRRKRWDWLRMQVGVQYLLVGLFKKMVVADRLALYADPVFRSPEAYGSVAVWLATLAYALQIYCDFSGYSDMAVGSAHLLGYRLARNFDLPYLAANVTEFWRRWHISLSSWLRDYLFIPLGGSRGTTWRTCRNLLLTMALGGLWHGASWHFVLWGLVHGTLLVIHRGLRALLQTRPRLDSLLRSGPGTVFRVGLTFLTVALCWVLFRAPTASAALAVYARLAAPHVGLPSAGALRPLLGLLALGALAHLVAQAGRKRAWAQRLPAPAVGLAYAALLVLAEVLAPGANNAFIYFQF